MIIRKNCDNILFTKGLNMNKLIIMKIQRTGSYSKWIISMAALLLCLSCAAEKVFASDLSLYSFGNGKKEVRLYSNFFCSHCRDLEPKIEYPLINLVKRNAITLTFVDLASNKAGVTYIKSFLYTLNAKKELSYTMKVRAALFEASRQQITEADKLESFMRSKGFAFKTFDVEPVFNTFTRYIQEDKIESTPVCVIINGKNKETYMGTEPIVKALENLR